MLLGQPASSSVASALSFSVDDAAALLKSATAIVARNPACNSPILAKFQAFIINSRGNPGAYLDLSASEAAQLETFKACAESRVSELSLLPGTSSSARERLAGGLGLLGAAALVGWLAWRASA